MSVPTIFTRFLGELGVPHTEAWSDKEFNDMTFKSLYGLSHLLTVYGVTNRGVKIADKTELDALTPPFLAQTKAGVFVIVREIADGRVAYDSRGELLTIDADSFRRAWNGIALLAFPDNASREPGYGAHRLSETVASLSKYALAAAALIVLVYFFVTRHVYAHASTVLLAAFNLVGLFFSYLLLQKSLNIRSSAGDRVCGVLEKGGCDEIMQLSASKLFGVFAWSEVGFGYFGVSLATLLMFPHMWPALALCNVCCLPYTVWSIWYQRFRAHHWCTLCVGVQSTLWCLFGCYLFGGWLGKAFPLHPDLIVLLAVYVFAVIFLNLLLRIFKNLPQHEKDSGA